MLKQFRTRLLALLALLATTPVARAQFVHDTTHVPTVAVGATEQVDFADVDNDGDWDVAIADGGDFGNQQNRIWINQGGLQGGALGTFVDETATRMPALLDSSRDVEFADIDADGDVDLFVANHSSIVNQASRFLINMGGAQGGTLGFFQDQTSTRWVNLGVNSGGQGSSIFPGLVLAGGGWIDYISDGDFGDLDGDGDMDLVPSSVGPFHSGTVPTRLFLNNGGGFFEEYNPSGFQLPGGSISNNNPGLWCQGLFQEGTQNTSGQFCDIANTSVDSDLGDIDGDFDLDFLMGDRATRPRMFRNFLDQPAGFQPWRDVTWISFPQNLVTGNGHYEQEFGDLDNDGDLDIYGLNFLVLSSFNDVTAVNDGAGNYSNVTTVPQSASDDEEVDFLDFDNDGDLDAMVANFSGQDRLYSTAPLVGGPTLTNVTSTMMPADSTQSRDVDTGDLDSDGDSDAMMANDAGQAEWYLRNTSSVPDTTASRIVLEYVHDRDASSAPTVVRAEIYGNAADYTTGYDRSVIEYSINAGPILVAPMRHGGAQLFRGEIPGNLIGQIDYRVRTTDEHGNVGVSAAKSYASRPQGCASLPLSYCVAKPTSNGCVPNMDWLGFPSASNNSGFLVACQQLRNSQGATLLYGFGGQASIPFFGGTLCIAGALHSGPSLMTGGSVPPINDCTGSVMFDMNAYAAGLLGGSPAAALTIPGTLVECQWLSRDRGYPAPNTAAMSGGLEYSVCP